MLNKQGGNAIQVQKQEQRQVASAQQILTAKLMELSVEELYARIMEECDSNPWLESSSPADAGDGYDNNPFDDMHEGEGEDFDPDSGTYEPDTSMSVESDDDFPQPEKYDESNKGERRENGEELSFHDMLIQQMGEYELSEHEQKIMEYLIGSLDEDGLIRIPLGRVADELDIYHNVHTHEEEVAHVLEILQQFDPWGVGARNLMECLLIQARRNVSLPMRGHIIRLLTEYANDLSLGHWDQIQKKMKLSNAEVTVIRHSLRRLNPRPGGSVGASTVDNNAHVVPDFIVKINEDGKPYFYLNEKNLPIITLADDFTDESALMQVEASNEKLRAEVIQAQRFQKNRMDEGRIFIEALAMRRRSMIVTMGAILKLQEKYFVEGDETMLRPMKLEDISALTKQDISTVSRVCRSKSVETPYGVHLLSWFFSSSVQKDGESHSVKKMMNALQEIVRNEDKKKPYSDEALSRILREKGYDIARRTIAKYRIQLGIPDSRLRR